MNCFRSWKLHTCLRMRNPRKLWHPTITFASQIQVSAIPTRGRRDSKGGGRELKSTAHFLNERRPVMEETQQFLLCLHLLQLSHTPPGQKTSKHSLHRTHRTPDIQNTHTRTHTAPKIVKGGLHHRMQSHQKKNTCTPTHQHRVGRMCAFTGTVSSQAHTETETATCTQRAQEEAT